MGVVPPSCSLLFWNTVYKLLEVTHAVLNIRGRQCVAVSLYLRNYTVHFTNISFISALSPGLCLCVLSSHLIGSNYHLIEFLKEICSFWCQCWSSLHPHLALVSHLTCFLMPPREGKEEGLQSWPGAVDLPRFVPLS